MLKCPESEIALGDFACFVVGFASNNLVDARKLMLQSLHVRELVPFYLFAIGCPTNRLSMQVYGLILEAAKFSRKARDENACASSDRLAHCSWGCTSLLV